MTKRYWCTLVFVLLLFHPAAPEAEEIELPQVSASAGHVFIANRTSQHVVFYLESRNTRRTEHALDPKQSATYTGDNRDMWFNIEVFTNGKPKIAYGLNAGSRYYLQWNSHKGLDVYKMSAK